MNTLVLNILRYRSEATGRRSGSDSVWSSADAGKGLAAVIVFAVLPLLSYAAQFSPLRFGAVLGTAVMTGFASFAIGSLFGLLFGLPKVALVSNSADSPGADIGDRSDEGYGPNTNLEQISDWLTAALVGAGLTQLGSLGEAASSLAQFLAPGFGNVSSSAALGLVTVVYFLVFGFLFGYLMARIRLASAFQRADRRARLAREEVTNVIRDLPAPAEEDNASAGVAEGSMDLDEAGLRRLEAAQQQTQRLADKGVQLAAADYRRLARQLKATGHFKEAVQAYEKAFDAEPTNPAPLNFAGVILSRDLNRPDQAEAYYRRALAVDPNYMSAIYNMACNEARRGRTEQALALLALSVTSADGDRYRVLAKRDSEDPSGPFASLAQHERFRDLVGAPPEAAGS